MPQTHSWQIPLPCHAPYPNSTKVNKQDMVKVEMCYKACSPKVNGRKVWGRKDTPCPGNGGSPWEAGWWEERVCEERDEEIAAPCKERAVKSLKNATTNPKKKQRKSEIKNREETENADYPAIPLLRPLQNKKSTMSHQLGLVTSNVCKRGHGVAVACS